MEAEDIKREINKIETSEGCNINSVKLTSDLGSKIIQNLIAAELKEKDIIISEYHIKMIADKESYFEVVESYGDLESQLKEVKKGKIIERCKEIELLEKYSVYLEKHGYMDIDWRTEEPYAIDDYFIEQRDKLLK